MNTPGPHDPPRRDPYLVSSFGLGVPNCKDSFNQEYTRDNDTKGQSISCRCPDQQKNSDREKCPTANEIRFWYCNIDVWWMIDEDWTNSWHCFASQMGRANPTKKNSGQSKLSDVVSKKWKEALERFDKYLHKGTGLKFATIHYQRP